MTIDSIINSLSYEELQKIRPDEFFERVLPTHKKQDMFDRALNSTVGHPELEGMKRRGFMRLRGEYDKLPPSHQNKINYTEFVKGWYDEAEVMVGLTDAETGTAPGILTGGEQGLLGLQRSVGEMSPVGSMDGIAKTVGSIERLAKQALYSWELPSLGQIAATVFEIDQTQEQQSIRTSGQQAFLSTATDHDSWMHTISNSAAGIGVGMVSGGTGAGAFMGTQVFGSSLGDYESMALSGQIDYDQTDAYVYAGMTAAFETASEKIGIDALGRIGRRWAMGGGSPIKKGVHAVLASAVTEGLEEGANQAASELITPIATNIEYNTAGEMLWNTTSAIGAGAVMGGVFSPAFAVSGAGHKKRLERRYDKGIGRIGLRAEVIQNRINTAAGQAATDVLATTEDMRGDAADQYDRRSKEASTNAGVAAHVLNSAESAHRKDGNDRGDAYAEASIELGEVEREIAAAAADGDMDALTRAVARLEAVATRMSSVSDIGGDAAWNNATTRIASALELAGGSAGVGRKSATHASKYAMNTIGGLRRAISSYERQRDSGMEAQSEETGSRIVHAERAASDLSAAIENSVTSTQYAIESKAAAVAAKNAAVSGEVWTVTDETSVLASQGENEDGTPNTIASVSSSPVDKQVERLLTGLGFRVQFYEGSKVEQAFWNPATPDVVYMKSGQTDFAGAASKGIHETIHYLQLTDPVAYDALINSVSGLDMVEGIRKYIQAGRDSGTFNNRDASALDMLSALEADMAGEESDVTARTAAGETYAELEGTARFVEGGAGVAASQGKFGRLMARMGMRGKSVMAATRAMQLVKASMEGRNSSGRMYNPGVAIDPNTGLPRTEMDAATAEYDGLPLYTLFRQMNQQSQVETDRADVATGTAASELADALGLTVSEAEPAPEVSDPAEEADAITEDEEAAPVVVDTEEAVEQKPGEAEGDQGTLFARDGFVIKLKPRGDNDPSVDAMLSEWRDKTTKLFPEGFEMGVATQRVLKVDDADVLIDADPDFRREDAVSVGSITMLPEYRQQGYASRAMRMMTNLADKHGVTLKLTASAFGPKPRLETGQLVQWYERHGFEFDLVAKGPDGYKGSRKPKADVDQETLDARSDVKIAGKAKSRVQTEDIRDATPESVRLGGQPNPYQPGKPSELISGRLAGSEEVRRSRTEYNVTFDDGDVEEASRLAAETIGEGRAEIVRNLMSGKLGASQQGDRSKLPLFDADIFNNTLVDPERTNDDRFWFESSALAASERLVGLNPDNGPIAAQRLTLFADLLSATSPQANVSQNFRRALGVMVDALAERPNWMGMQSAPLVRKALSGTLRGGNNYKTGSFAPAFLHALGLDPNVPLTTNDIWVAYMSKFRDMSDAKDTDQYPGTGDNKAFADPYVYQYQSVYFGHLTEIMNEKVQATDEYQSAKAKYDAGQPLSVSEEVLITPWSPGQFMAYPWSHLSESDSFASAIDEVVDQLVRENHSAVVDLPDGRKGIDLEIAAVAPKSLSETLEPSTTARKEQAITQKVGTTATPEGQLESEQRQRIVVGLEQEGVDEDAKKTLREQRSKLDAVHTSFMKWLAGKGSGLITQEEVDNKPKGHRFRGTTGANQALSNATGVLPKQTLSHPMLGELISAITGRRYNPTQALADIDNPKKPIRLITLSEGVDKQGQGAVGLWGGVMSPNMIISMAGMTRDQRLVLMRLFGTVLQQEGMGAIRFAGDKAGMTNPVDSAQLYTTGRTISQTEREQLTKHMNEVAPSATVTIVPATSGDVVLISDPMGSMSVKDRVGVIGSSAQLIGATVQDGYADMEYLDAGVDTDYARGHEDLVDDIIAEDASPDSDWQNGLTDAQRQAIKRVAPTEADLRVLLASGGRTEAVGRASQKDRRAIGGAVGRSRGWRIRHALSRISEQQAKFNTEVGRVAQEVKSTLDSVDTLNAREGDVADQTETPEFKAWFGDSMVVADDGKPLVVYHGTHGSRAGFNVFDLSKAPKSPDAFGFWFTSNADVASGIYGAHGATYPVYLKMEQPWETTWEDFIRHTGHVQDVKSGEPWNRDPQKIRDYLKTSGRDGVLIKGFQESEGEGLINQRQDLYVVLNPTQIRSSITGNILAAREGDVAADTLDARDDTPLPIGSHRDQVFDYKTAQAVAKGLRDQARGATDPVIATALRAAARDMTKETEASRKEYRSLRSQQVAKTKAAKAGFTEGLEVGRRKLREKLAKIDERSEKDKVRNLKIKLKAEERAARGAVKELRSELAEVKRAVKAALGVLPWKLRGQFTGRAIEASTLADVSKIAHEIVKASTQFEAAATKKDIRDIRKRFKRRGMTNKARDEIKRNLDLAEGLLTGSNNRVINLDSVTETLDRVRRARDLLEIAIDVYQQERLSWKEAVAQRRERLQADKEEAAANIDATEANWATRTSRKMRKSRLGSGAVTPGKVGEKLQESQDADGIFETLEGNDSVLKRGWNKIRAAKSRMWKDQQSVDEKVEEAIKKAGYSSKEDFLAKTTDMYGETAAETITVTLGGEKMTITLSEALSIAAMDNETVLALPRDQAEIIENGDGPGIVFRETAHRTRIQATQQEVEAVREMIGPNHMQLIQDLKDILEEDIRDRAFNVHYSQHNKMPPVVENYWPRARRRADIGEDLSGDSSTSPDPASPPSLTVEGKATLDNAGFLQKRSGGGAAIVISNLFNVFDYHVAESLSVIHLSRPLREFDALLRDETISSAISEKMGDNGIDRIQDMLKYGVGLTGTQSDSSWLNRIQSNVAGAYLIAAVETWVRMFGGSFRLMSEIPILSWTKGFASIRSLTPGARGNLVHRIEEQSGYFHERHRRSQIGRYSNLLRDSRTHRQFLVAISAFGRSMKKIGQDDAASAVEKAVDSIKASGQLGLGILSVLRGFDHVLRGIDRQIMLIAVQGHMAEGLTFEQAVDRAVMTFRRTQNTSDAMDDTMYAARTKGKNSAFRSLLMFSSDPLKAYNQLRHAIRDWKVDPARAGRTAVAVTLNSGLSAGVGLAFSAGLFSLFDDDDEWNEVDREIQRQMAMDREIHKAKRRLLEDAVTQSTGVIGWFVSSVFYSVDQIIAGGYKSSDPVEIAALSEVSEIIEDMAGVVKQSMAERDDEWTEKTLDLSVRVLNDAATLTGVPTEAPMRTIRKIREVAAGPNTEEILKELRRRKRDGEPMTRAELNRLYWLEKQVDVNSKRKRNGQSQFPLTSNKR